MPIKMQGILEHLQRQIDTQSGVLVKTMFASLENALDGVSTIVPAVTYAKI